jgi:hypothetical protein
VGFRKNRRIRHLLTLRYPTLELDQEDAVAVSDAQFGPNEFGICPDAGAHCRIDDVGTTTQEIPLTQNHPSKCRSNTIFSFIIRP